MINGIELSDDRTDGDGCGRGRYASMTTVEAMARVKFFSSNENYNSEDIPSTLNVVLQGFKTSTRSQSP